MIETPQTYGQPIRELVTQKYRYIAATISGGGFNNVTDALAKVCDGFDELSKDFTDDMRENVNCLELSYRAVCEAYQNANAIYLYRTIKTKMSISVIQQSFGRVPNISGRVFTPYMDMDTTAEQQLYGENSTSKMDKVQQRRRTSIVHAHSAGVEVVKVEIFCLAMCARLFLL